MEGASPPITSPAENITSPATNGRPSPARSAWSPATTMPIRIPRKNAVVTQPYHDSPTRSSSMSGRIVITASASTATSVTVATIPMVSALRCGLSTPSDSVTRPG
ncbi:MAG: hypothetical protein WKF58_18135 [Ilumatobacteraceae bacterium]